MLCATDQLFNLVCLISLGPCLLPAAPAEAARELLIESLPEPAVKNHAPKHRVKLLVDGQIAREFEINWPSESPTSGSFSTWRPSGETSHHPGDGLPADSSAVVGYRAG